MDTVEVGRKASAFGWQAASHRLAPPGAFCPEDVRQALDDSAALVPAGERCPTCHAAIRARYCTVCGEERPGRRPQSVVSFLRAATARMLNADNRLLRAFAHLISRPGALTVAFLEGRRRPFLGPLQLFATINVAYFLFATSGLGFNTFHTPLRIHVASSTFYHNQMAQRWVNARIGAPEEWSYVAARAAADSLAQAGGDSPGQPASPAARDTTALDAAAPRALPPHAAQAPLAAFEAYAERFDRQAEWLSKSLVFLFIPAFAVWFWGLHLVGWQGRRRRGLLPFVVQGTHVWGALLLILTGVAVFSLSAQLLLRLVGVSGAGILTEPVLTVILGVSVVAYLTVALRRVHGEGSWRGWVGAALRAGATFAVLIPILQAYRVVLFVIGFYTT